MCLGSLPTPVIQLPRSNGVDEAVAAPLERYLREARVKFRRFENERWLAFTFEPLRAPGGEIRAGLADQADALIAMTAWEFEDGTISCRTRYEDARLRRRLLAALVGDQRGFQVKWLPGYFPVEARIYARAAAAMRPFVPVEAALPERVRTLHVETSAPGHLLVGLAVTVARAS